MTEIVSAVYEGHHICWLIVKVQCRQIIESSFLLFELSHDVHRSVEILSMIVYQLFYEEWGWGIAPPNPDCAK